MRKIQADRGHVQAWQIHAFESVKVHRVRVHRVGIHRVRGTKAACTWQHFEKSGNNFCRSADSSEPSYVPGSLSSGHFQTHVVHVLQAAPWHTCRLASVSASFSLLTLPEPATAGLFVTGPVRNFVFSGGRLAAGGDVVAPRHMGWLRTVRNSVLFVTAPSSLLDPLCLAALNTGIPFMGSLPETLTLNPVACWGEQGVGHEHPGGAVAACQCKAGMFKRAARHLLVAGRLLLGVLAATDPAERRPDPPVEPRARSPPLSLLLPP
eukprot:366554-Chlamydomonas_euryale.AAC.2